MIQGNKLPEGSNQKPQVEGRQTMTKDNGQKDQQ